MKNTTLPKFVWFGNTNKNKGTAMRLDSTDKDVGHYWRDGGAWGTDAKMVDGKLISFNHSGDFSYLNNKELVRCTKAEWKKDNGEYAPKI